MPTMQIETLRPVTYRGELVALAGRNRFHFVAPWLSELPDGDITLRFIELLCTYHREILRGALPDSRDPERAEQWATLMLGSVPPLPG